MRSALQMAAVGFAFIAAAQPAFAASPRDPASAADVKATSAHKPVCDASALLPCSDLAKASLNGAKSPSLGLGTQRDGGAIFNSFSYFKRASSKDPAVLTALAQEQTKLATSNATSSDLKERMKPIVAAAKDVILNGSTEPTPEQKLLLERLDTLNFVVQRESIDAASAEAHRSFDQVLCDSNTLLGFPNAGYLDRTHTLYVCPAMMNMTASVFTQLLSHEIAHVVSPCKERETLFRVDSGNAFHPQLDRCDDSFFHDKNGAETGPQNDLVAVLLEQKPNYSVNQKGKLTDLLEAKGCEIMKASNLPAVEKPKLYAKTMTCLSKRNASSYGELRDRYALSQMIKHVPESAAKSDYERENPPYCQRIAEENFADSFEAKILSSLAANWKKKDYQAALLVHEGYVCAEHEGKNFSGADYPSFNVRIETILNDPSAQSRLNCESPSDHLCPLEVTPENVKSSVGAGPSATSRKTSTGSQR